MTTSTITASQIERMITIAAKEGQELNESNILGYFALALINEKEMIETVLNSHNRGVGKEIKDQMCEEVYNELRAS